MSYINKYKISIKKNLFIILVFISIISLFPFGCHHHSAINRGTGQRSTIEVIRNDHIFLGAKFGMSVKETSDALALMNARLLNPDEYLETSNTKLLEYCTTFIPFHPDWEKWECYYMPEIILFDSFAEASFEFVNDELLCIDVYFSPFLKTESQLLVDTLDEIFKTKYTFERRKESTTTTILGAYTLVYRKNEAIVHLWVNLTDMKNPSINVNISDNFAKAKWEKKRKEIEAHVF